MKILRILGILAGFLVASHLYSQQPPALGGAAAATVRLPSHGASCTIIYSEPNRTIMLGCGHAYEGKSRNDKMAFDIPTNQPSPKGVAHSKLLAVDYKADLSLVEIDKGPFPFVAPVAPDDYHLDSSHHFIAAGYDSMEFPPHQVTVHIVGKDNRVWYTREKPWHGRSGGGLIDVDSGVLIGVCEGYEVVRDGKGLYVNLDAIHTFLKTYWPQYNRPPPQQQPPVIVIPYNQAPIVVPPKTTQIDIPPECRVKNKTGVQCAWASIETCARYLKIERLYDLTDKYPSSEVFSLDGITQLLNSRHVHFKVQNPGNYDKTILIESISKGFPVIIGRKGPPDHPNWKHVMVLVDINDKIVKILANSTDQEIHEDKLWAFEKSWDGWAIVLYPDVKDETPQQLPIKKSPSSPLDQYYQDVGPVIPKERFPNYQPQYIQPRQQYVPRQRQSCPT